jgi:hypothetical protein
MGTTIADVVDAWDLFILADTAASLIETVRTAFQRLEHCDHSADQDAVEVAVGENGVLHPTGQCHADN